MDATIDPSPTLTIRPAALRGNLGVVRAAVGPMRAIYAVVKANAYGHGVDVVAPAVTDRVDGFVVVTLNEAHALRALPGLAEQKIIVLQPIEPALHSPQTIARAVAAGLTLTPGSIDGLRAIAAAAARLRRSAPIQLHLDTGLRRCGVDLALADAIAAEALGSPTIRWTDVSTHGAFQDAPDALETRRQLAAFDAFVSRWRPRVPDLIAHAAASGLALLCPDARHDAVRIGAAMYGIDPLGQPDASRPLKPAMRLTAPVVALRELRSGEGVGYGHTFVARRAMRVAVLPVGYFDGLPRAATNKTRVIVDGFSCRCLGTISMDLVVIDVTHVLTARIGTVATVIDDDAISPASASAWAAAANTVTYEIVSRIGPRARRIVASEERAGMRLEYVRRTSHAAIAKIA